MKFIPGQDYRLKIERINRLCAARTRLSELTPLDERSRAQVEQVTRYERRHNMVEVIGGRQVRTPFHKSCQ